MSPVDQAKAQIKLKSLRLVIPQGEDERIRAAAEILRSQGLAIAILFCPETPEPSGRHIDLVLRQRGKMTKAMASRLLQKPLCLAAAMVAGAINPTARVIEAGLMMLGLAQ